jgi:hypothetical protein
VGRGGLGAGLSYSVLKMGPVAIGLDSPAVHISAILPPIGEGGCGCPGYVSIGVGCDWSCQSIANESRVFPRIQPRAKENSRQQIYQMRVLASYNHFCKAQNLYRKKTK